MVTPFGHLKRVEHGEILEKPSTLVHSSLVEVSHTRPETWISTEIVHL